MHSSIAARSSSAMYAWRPRRLRVLQRRRSSWPGAAGSAAGGAPLAAAGFFLRKGRSTGRSGSLSIGSESSGFLSDSNGFFKKPPAPGSASTKTSGVDAALLDDAALNVADPLERRALGEAARLRAHWPATTGSSKPALVNAKPFGSLKPRGSCAGAALARCTTRGERPSTRVEHRRVGAGQSARANAAARIDIIATLFADEPLGDSRRRSLYEAVSACGGLPGKSASRDSGAFCSVTCCASPMSFAIRPLEAADVPAAQTLRLRHEQDLIWGLRRELLRPTLQKPQSP